jgi:putative flippase GtrA
MRIRRHQLKDLFLLKLKFAGSSSVATLVDYILYLSLVNRVLTPGYANLVSSGTGMLINFFLQKKYVFHLDRKVHVALLISLVTSLIGIGLSTLIVITLSKVEFFNEVQFLTKAIATGLVFFYNFFMKRFAFERKFV